MKQPDHDPRKDPRVGDMVSFRDKPVREVIQRFTEACGEEWITYAILKQMPLKQWKRSTRGAHTL